MEVNQIICGDCLKVLKQMPDDFVDCVVTSPPYNANQRLSSAGRFVALSPAEKDQRTKYQEFNDALSPQDYYEWQSKIISELLRVCRNQIFYNIQLLSPNKLAIFKIFGKFADKIKEIIVWDKKHSEPAIQEGVMNSEWEFVIVFDNKDAIKRRFENANFLRGTYKNILRIKKNSGNDISDINSACFPIELPSSLIRGFSREGDLILDPFVGSGTTCMAAKQLNRNYIGIDISEKYCEISRQRLRQEILL